MSLGEAFIEVRADLRTFGRDLQKSVPPIIRAFEKELNAAVSRTASKSGEQGRSIGDRLGKGLRHGIDQQFGNKNIFIGIASALGSALDDGISALPTEVKAAIVAGILAASPLVIGGLTGLVVGGIGAVIAGIGVALAAQFDIVQTRGIEFGRELRKQLVESAGDFVPAVIHAMDIVEARIRMLRGSLDEIFNVSSNFVEPLTEGALDAVDELVNAIRDSIDDIKPFVDELGSTFQQLGSAIGEAIRILVSTGDDGVKALRDLVTVIGSAIVAAALMIKFFTHLYGLIRNILVVTGDLVGPFSIIAAWITKLIRLIDERSNRNKAFVNTNVEATDSIEGMIVATKGETDALEEYKKALEGASTAARENLELNVAWEESLDNITKSLEENGKTLDIHTEKGRANVKEFIEGLKLAEERALARITRGEQTAAQAAAQYQAEVVQLRNLATQAGISEAAFNNLFNEMIVTSSVRISSQDIGINELGGSLDTAADAAKRLKDLLEIIQHLGKTIGAGALAGVKGFDDGGVARFPQLATVAESGAEAIIPLTNPGRAAQLLQQTGLASLVSGGGPSQIMVFIGNEQLDSRMVRIVERSNSAQAVSLSQGPRRF